MSAAMFNIFLLAAEVREGGETSSIYGDYLNIPGFEAWKFINLTIFVLVMIYLLKKPLSNAFKAKRDAIRAELVKAEEEKQAALARLAVAEGKLLGLEREKAAIIESARTEAEDEKRRIESEAEAESRRLRDQSTGEISRLIEQMRGELRRLSANESIRLAEQKLRSQIDAERDQRLVKTSIETIGSLN